MNPPRYHLTSQAQRDLTAVLTYLLREAGETVTRRIDQKFEATFEHIADFPLSGHRRDELPSESQRILSVANYLIIYDAESQPPVIQRVIHGSRNIQNLI